MNSPDSFHQIILAKTAQIICLDELHILLQVFVKLKYSLEHSKLIAENKKTGNNSLKLKVYLICIVETYIIKDLGFNCNVIAN